MRKTALLKILQREIDTLGDTLLMSYTIEDENGGNSWYLLSDSDNRDRYGNRKKMKYKEFNKYVAEARSISKGDKN